MSTTQQNPRREHALHNEQACLYLYESGNFPDWVVSTAFYSALHFVKYKAFPLTDNGRTFIDFDEYFLKERTSRAYGTSPHDILNSLVNKHLRNISAAYRELFDLCHTARYDDYQTSRDDVALALQNLEEVKRFCNTEKPDGKSGKRPRLVK